MNNIDTKTHKKTTGKMRISLPTNREGGRTVGAGSVTAVIE